MTTTIFIRPDAAIKNLVYYIHVLKELPCTVSLDLLNGSQAANQRPFAVCTRVDSEFENWLYWPDGLKIHRDAIHRAIDFFNRQGVPFVWPILESDDNKAHELAHELEAVGLQSAGELTIMNWNAGSILSQRLAQVAQLKSNQNSDLILNEVKSHADAERWADSVWINFDDGAMLPVPTPPAPVEFRAFASCLADRSDVTLGMACRADGAILGNFMTLNSGTEMGVYYFATAAAARRKGIATAMMQEIGKRAREAQTPLVVLQATPEGVPFYDSAGFVAFKTITAYSVRANKG